MPDGTSGIQGGGGFFGKFAENWKDTKAEDQMKDAMNVPVQAGDNKGAQERLQNVREQVKQLSPQEAGKLLDQLNDKHSKDPLASQIRHTFSDASVEKLKGDLRVQSGRASAGETLQHKADDILRSPKEKQTRKADIDLVGQLKAHDLFDKVVADQVANKMFKAADVMHKNPDAILAAMKELSPGGMKELQKIFPEKFGVSLDVFLNGQLDGPRLKEALDLVQGAKK